MKKLQLQVLILACSLGLNAQTKTDSLKKIRFSGIAFELFGIGSQQYTNVSKEEFQKFVKNDNLLDKDLTGYYYNSDGSNIDFNGIISVKAFIELGQGKRFRREGFIGLRMGSSTIAQSSYFKYNLDTIDTYYSNSTNNVVYQTALYTSVYIYQITSKRFFVPLGIGLTTNKNRRFWFGAGLELSPGITFENTFSARYSEDKRESYINLSSHTPYASTANHEPLDFKKTTSKLKGIGFVGYASLPLSMNIRLSKKIKVLKQINLSTSIAPGIYYSQNKFIGSQTDFVVNTSLGLRYNW